VSLDQIPSAKEELLALGCTRGFITYEELNTALPAEMADPDQRDALLVQIDILGIKLVDGATLPGAEEPAKGGVVERYRITGKDIASGYDTDLVIEAENPQQAVLLAQSRGCQVSDIALASAPSPRYRVRGIIHLRNRNAKLVATTTIEAPTETAALYLAKGKGIL
jgi:hypothetical protein